MHYTLLYSPQWLHIMVISWWNDANLYCYLWLNMDQKANACVGCIKMEIIPFKIMENICCVFSRSIRPWLAENGSRNLGTCEYKEFVFSIAV